MANVISTFDFMKLLSMFAALTSDGWPSFR